MTWDYKHTMEIQEDSAKRILNWIQAFICVITKKKEEKNHFNKS